MNRWWVCRGASPQPTFDRAPRLVKEPDAPRVHAMPEAWAPHVKRETRPSVRLTFDTERDKNVFMRALTSVGFAENAPQGALFRRA
jgi:hypothetical protein